jgi:hypothetical protein
VLVVTDGRSNAASVTSTAAVCLSCCGPSHAVVYLFTKSNVVSIFCRLRVKASAPEKDRGRQVVSVSVSRDSQCPSEMPANVLTMRAGDLDSLLMNDELARRQ